jgi:hypothetical protein
MANLVTNVLDLDVVVLLVTGSQVGLNGLDIDVGDLSLITVEDLGDLLEGGSLGLDVEDADEDELEGNPALSGISTSANG